MDQLITEWSVQVDDWEYIIDCILDQKCMLFLGPDFPSTDKGFSFYEALVASLPESDLNNKVIYHNSDQLFFFEDPTVKNTFYNKFRRLHQKMKPSSALRKIAALPFHVIVAATSDTLLLQALEEYNYFFQHYDKLNGESVVTKSNYHPTHKQPYIYNLLGNIDKTETLVLSNDDIYDFTINLLGKQMIPSLIELETSKAETILFLGFGMHKWYMKLILKLFQIHNSVNAKKYAIGFSREEQKEPGAAINKVLGDTSKLFCEKHLKINFLEGTEEGFINALYASFNKDHLRAKKKGLKNDKLSMEYHKEKINALIEDDELKEAIETIEKNLKEIEKLSMIEDAILLKSRLQRVKRERYIKGTINNDEYSIEINRIRTGILYLLEESIKPMI